MSKNEDNLLLRVRDAAQKLVNEAMILTTGNANFFERALDLKYLLERDKPKRQTEEVGIALRLAALIIGPTDGLSPLVALKKAFKDAEYARGRIETKPCKEWSMSIVIDHLCCELHKARRSRDSLEGRRTIQKEELKEFRREHNRTGDIKKRLLQKPHMAVHEKLPKWLLEWAGEGDDGT